MKELGIEFFGYEPNDSTFLFPQNLLMLELVSEFKIKLGLFEFYIERGPLVFELVPYSR